MIGISSCLAGVKCRYDGTGRMMDGVEALMAKGRIMGLCPEVLGGLETPRVPAEIRWSAGERSVVSKTGEDVTEAFMTGARRTVEICKEHDIRHVVLKERSPSCGKGKIYSGRFDGRLVEGNGVTVELLEEEGIQVHCSESVSFRKLEVYDTLESFGIPYSVYKHQPVFTVEEAKVIEADIPGQHCKNLFLRNRKGNVYYLVILPQDEPFEIKELKDRVIENRLSFASPRRLKEVLGVEPGSVSVFGLVNDRCNKVHVVLSRKFDKEDHITFHPNENDETLSIAYRDLEKFLRMSGYEEWEEL